MDKTLEDGFYKAYLARGYIFQARVEAWKLFCGKLGTDPFECWRPFPGYDHLMRDIDLATPSDPDSRITFTFDEFVDHLNTVGDKPVDPSAIVSPDSLARELEKAFGELVKGWGG